MHRREARDGVGCRRLAPSPLARLRGVCRPHRIILTICAGAIAAVTLGVQPGGSVAAPAHGRAAVARESQYEYRARGPRGYTFLAQVLFRDSVPIEVQTLYVHAGRCWRDRDHGPVKPFPTAWYAAGYLKVDARGHFSDKRLVRHPVGLPLPPQGPVAGTVDAKRITGTLRRPTYHLQAHGVPVTCSTGVVRFSVRRGRLTWTSPGS